MSNNRMTIFSPKSVGMMETRKSSSFILPWYFILILMRPSCGRRFSEMSSFGHDLETAGDGVAQLERRLHDFIEHAVDPEPHTILPLVGLDVDIRGATLERIGEHEVDELDDRRLFRGCLELVQADVLLVFHHLEIGGGTVIVRLDRRDVVHHLLELKRRRGAVVLAPRSRRAVAISEETTGSTL